MYWPKFTKGFSSERVKALVDGIDSCVVNCSKSCWCPILSYLFHPVLTGALAAANMHLSFLWCFPWWMEPAPSQVRPAGPAPSPPPATHSPHLQQPLPIIHRSRYQFPPFWGVECKSKAPVFHWFPEFAIGVESQLPTRIPCTHLRGRLLNIIPLKFMAT